MRWLAAIALAAASWAALAQPAQQTVVNVLDTNVLNVLEDTGFSLSETLGGTKNTLTADLYRSNPLYRNLADVIGKPLVHNANTDQLPTAIPPGSGDIPDMVRLIRNFEDKGKRSEKDTKGGYFIRHLSNNSQYPYAVEFDGDEPRHFDQRWLNSTFGAMKLIGIVNRMDRVDFDSTSCGEVRFVYRLSYRTPKSSSSLPFFLNVVKTYPKQTDCAPFARRWQSAQTAATLANTTLKDLTFKQVELNFQSLRFTSGYMHDFGGQAMYMQRIFRLNGGKLEPVALENTPDVLAVERNSALMTRFVDYLKQGDRLARLDNGTLVIDFDPAFLTKLAVSWSTLGRARTANKPYSRLFQGKRALLESIDISKLKFIKSHDALVERLNNLTCMGCHQSGGTAGFHLLGYADEKYSHHFNRQQSPLSPHAYAEQFRRHAYVEALAAGRAPNSFRPHSNFPEAVWPVAGETVRFHPAMLGQSCTTPAAFSGAPVCAPVDGRTTTCERSVTSKTQNVLFGECVVKGSRAFAGAACWRGEVSEVAALPQDRGPIPSYNLFAFQDKWKFGGSLYNAGETQGLKCVLPQSGAPLGRTSRACSLAEENFTGVDPRSRIPSELCANQGGNGFDLCAATGNSGACLEARVVRGMLDACSPGRGCREDYICQKLPDYDKIKASDYANTKNGRRVNQSSPDKINSDAISSLHAAEVGFCVPTYFLFNMRLDGHPSPVTGQPPGTPRIDRTQPIRGYR
ncbi:MAG: hypothetical protein K8S25_02385 [Alphaproteobacteria bacterium]|nr:hypothetical protein [Alphaproteobacteria bacterium]